LSGVLIELFFRKRRSFPPLYCIVLLASAAYTLVDHVVASTLLTESQIGATTILHSVRAVIISGVWIAYLRLSKRVAATFVN